MRACPSYLLSKKAVNSSCMCYDLLFSDGAGNKMNELAGTGYKALLPVCSDREGENPACTKGEKSMNRKFKNFLRRALTGLLSITMIAGEFPVAALAAEPKAAVEEEAVYEEEAAAVSEDEVVAEVSEDETEVPAVSEDEAEEAVAETEETEEAAAEDAEEAVKEADTSVEETAEAEESEDGAMVPYLTYKLRFYLGEGKEAKARFDSLSANVTDAGKAYTDSLKVSSGSDNFDKKYINVDGDDRAVILSRDKMDPATFNYGSNSDNEADKEYSITYTLSVNEATVVNGVSENTGYKGYLVISGFNFLDGTQYMRSYDNDQYWDFSDSALYLITEDYGYSRTENYYYSINNYTDSMDITWNNDSSDGSVVAMVAYSDPKTTDPAWHVLKQGVNEIRTRVNPLYVKLDGFTRVPSTYVINAFNNAAPYDEEKNIWAVNNGGTITLDDGSNRPVYTVNIHNANKSGDITVQYKNKIDAAFSQKESVKAGAVIEGTAAKGLYGDSWNFDSLSMNVTVGKDLRFRYAFGPKVDDALNGVDKYYENEASISMNMADLSRVRPTEIDGEAVKLDGDWNIGNAEESVVWDLWLETVPAYAARYAVVTMNGDPLVFYADETNKDLLKGTREQVMRNWQSYGKGTMDGYLYGFIYGDYYNGDYLVVPAGETYYIRVFDEEDDTRYNVSLPEVVSENTPDYSRGPIYTKVSENKAGLAYAALTDSSLTLLGDGYYALSFSGKSEKDFTGTQVVGEIERPVALGLTFTPAATLTHKVNFEFVGDGAAKSSITDQNYDSDNVPDGKEYRFDVTPKNGWRIASVSGASIDGEGYDYITEPLYHDVTVTITTEYDPRDVVSVNFVSGNEAAAAAVKAIHFKHINGANDYTYIGSQTGLGKAAFDFTDGDRFEFEVADGYEITGIYVEGSNGTLDLEDLADENDCYYDVDVDDFKTDVINNIVINAKKVSDESHTVTFRGDLDRVKIFTSEQDDNIYDDLIEDRVYPTMDAEFKFMVFPADGYEVDEVIAGVDEIEAVNGVYTVNSAADVVVNISTDEGVGDIVKYFTIKTDSGVKKLILDGNELKNLGDNTYEVVLKMEGSHYLTAEFDEKRAEGAYIVTPNYPGRPFAFNGSYMLRVGSFEGDYSDAGLKAWENGTVYIHTYDVMDNDLPNNTYGLRVFNNEKFANVDTMDLMNAADGKVAQKFSTSANESVKFVEVSLSDNELPPEVYLEVKAKDGYDVKLYNERNRTTYDGIKFDGGVSFNEVALADPMSYYTLIVEPHVVSQIFHVPYGDLTFVNENGTGKLADIYFDEQGGYERYNDETDENEFVYTGRWIVNGRRKPYTVKASDKAIGFMTKKQHDKWIEEPTVDNWKFFTEETSLTISNPQEDAEYWIVYNPYFTVRLNDNGASEYETGSSAEVYKGGTYEITYYNQFGVPFTSKADEPASLTGDQSSKLGLTDKLGNAVVYVTDANGEDADLTYTYKLGKGNDKLFPDGTLTLKKINPSVKADTLTLPVDTFGSVSVDKPEQMGEDVYDEDEEEWINYYNYDYDKTGLADPHITWNDDDEVYDFSVTALPAIDAAAAEKEYSVSVNGDGFKLGNVTVKTVKPSLDGKTLPAVKDPQDTVAANSFTLVVPTVEELEKAGIVVDETIVGRVYWKVTVKGETGSNIQYFNYWKVVDGAYDLTIDGDRIAVENVLVTGLAENREYEWTLQLVQTGSATSMRTVVLADDTLAKDVQFATAVTEAKKIKTPTTYYATKLKLSKTSATVFTGQKDVALAEISFPESQVSFRQDAQRMVKVINTAKNYNDFGYDITDYGFDPYVKNGVLYLSVPYNFDDDDNAKADDFLQAGKLNLEVRTLAPDNTYWATAKFGLTVKQGIQTIDLGLEDQYYVVSGNGGKSLKITMKPAFNGAHKLIYTPEDAKLLDGFVAERCPISDALEGTNVAAPASKKVDWTKAILQYNESGDVNAVEGWVAAEGNAVDGVSIVKNTLNIAPGEHYGLKAYRILVPAADYAGSEIWSVYGNAFTVTNADDFANSHLVLIDKSYSVDNAIGMESFRIIGTEDGAGNITVSTNELAKFEDDVLAIVAVKNDAVIAEVDGDNDGVMEKFVPWSDLAYEEVADQYGLGLVFKPVSKGFKLAANGAFTGMSQAVKKTKITASLKNNSSVKALNGTVEITYSSINYALEIRENDPDMEQYYWDSASIRNVQDKKNMKADRYKDTASYYGTESTYITLGLKIGNVQKGTSDLDWIDAAFNDPDGEGKNFTIKVKGGKILKPVVQKYYAGRGEFVGENESYYWLSIKPGKAATSATVTITNKQDKSSKIYTITNNTVAGTAKVKVTADVKQLYDMAGETQAITFRAANAPAEADYLKIERNIKNVISKTVYDAKTGKRTVDKVTDKGYSALTFNTWDENDGIEIDRNGLHSVKGSENFKTKIYLGANDYVLPGSYKYVFTYGTKDENGEFKPLTAPANVTIKIKGDKKASFKLKTAYKLTARDQFQAELAGSSKGVEFVTVDEVLYANLNGNNNKFKDIIESRSFLANAASYRQTHWSHNDYKYHNDSIALNGNGGYLRVGDLTIDLNKITSKTDLTGYIRYTVHYKDPAVRDETRYGNIKIQLGPDEKKTAVKFKATSKGAIIDTENSYIAAYATVTAGGKPVNLTRVSLYSPNELFSAAQIVNVEATTNKEGLGINGTRNIVMLTGNNLENLNKMKGKTETVTLYVIPEDKNLYNPAQNINYGKAEYDNAGDLNLLNDYVSQYGVPVQVKINLNNAETVKSALTFSQTNVPEWSGMDQVKGEAPYTTWWGARGMCFSAVPVTANLPIANDLVVIKADGWDADNAADVSYAEFIRFIYITPVYGKSMVWVMIDQNKFEAALEKDPSLKGKTVDVKANVYIGKEEAKIERGATPNQQVSFKIALPDPYAVTLAEEKAAIEASIAENGVLMELIDDENYDDAEDAEDVENIVENIIEARLYGETDEWNYVTNYIDAFGKQGIMNQLTGKNALISNISATDVDVDYENGIAYITLARTDAEGNTESTVIKFRPNVERDADDYTGVLAAWAQANRKLFGKADINFSDEAQITAKLAEICKTAREAVMLPSNIGLSATLESNSESSVIAVRFTLKDHDKDTSDVAAVFSKGIAATLADAYVAANGAVNAKFLTGALSANNADKDISAEAQKAIDALPYKAVVTFTRIDTDEKINKLVEDRKITADEAENFRNALALKRLPFSIVISNVADKDADDYTEYKTGYMIAGLSAWASRDAASILNVFGPDGAYINENALLLTAEGLPDYSKAGIEAAVVKQAGGNQFAKVEMLTGKDGDEDQFKEATDTQEGWATIKVSTSANIARGIAEADTVTRKYLLPQKVSAKYYTTNLLTLVQARGDYYINDPDHAGDPDDYSNDEWVFDDLEDHADRVVSINGARYGYERYITDYVAAYPVDKETSVQIKFNVTYKRGSDVSTVPVVINLKGNTYASAAEVFTKGVNKISMTKALSKAEMQKAVDAIRYNATSITVNSEPAVVAATKLANGTATYDITVKIKVNNVEQTLTRQVTFTLASEGIQTLAEAQTAVKGAVSDCAALIANGTLNWSNGGADTLTNRIRTVVTDITKYDNAQYTIEYSGIYNTTVRTSNAASALTVTPAGDYTEGSVKGFVYIISGDAEAPVEINITIPADKFESHDDDDRE